MFVQNERGNEKIYLKHRMNIKGWNIAYPHARNPSRGLREIER